MPSASQISEWAQTFTAGTTGRLTGFDLWIERAPDVTRSLIFDIRTTEAGVPTEADFGLNILSRGVIFVDSIPVAAGVPGVPNPTFADTTSLGIEVTAGDVLAIRIFASTDQATNSGYFWRGNAPGGYTSGATFARYFTSTGDPAIWQTQNGVDQLFRTYVSPVPEPATATLLLLGMLGCYNRRSRSRLAQ